MNVCEIRLRVLRKLSVRKQDRLCMWMAIRNCIFIQPYKKSVFKWIYEFYKRQKTKKKKLKTKTFFFVKNSVSSQNEKMAKTIIIYFFLVHNLKRREKKLGFSSIELFMKIQLSSDLCGVDVEYNLRKEICQFKISIPLRELNRESQWIFYSKTFRW